MGKFCSSCGKPVNYDVAFCDSCGSALGEKQTINQQPVQQTSKFAYSLPAFANGILAVVLGAIGMIYVANAPVYGAARYFDKNYDRAVRAFYAASDRLGFLAGFGVALLVLGAIVFFLKPKKRNLVLNKVLWFVPMAVIILYALINYITIFGFEC